MHLLEIISMCAASCKPLNTVFPSTHLTKYEKILKVNSLTEEFLKSSMQMEPVYHILTKTEFEAFRSEGVLKFRTGPSGVFYGTDLCSDIYSAVISTCYLLHKGYLRSDDDLNYVLMVFHLPKGFLNSKAMSEAWFYKETGSLKCIRIISETMGFSREMWMSLTALSFSDDFLKIYSESSLTFSD